MPRDTIVVVGFHAVSASTLYQCPKSIKALPRCFRYHLVRS